MSDIEKRIIPFFKKNKLYTYKQNDFIIFSQIIQLMSKKEHLTKDGLVKIAKLIEKMNRKKKSRFLESPETKR